MVDEKDRLLLSLLQKGIPFIGRPFAVLGAKAGMDGADAILRIEKMRREGLLTDIRAFWDPQAFRYQGAWAAMKFSKNDFEVLSRTVYQHPGVVYGLERDHDLNFWFFLTAPAGHDLEAHFRILRKQTYPEASIFLPLRKVLKGNNLLSSLTGRGSEGFIEQGEKRRGVQPPPLTLDELRLIRLMQEPLLLTDEPFRKISESMNVPEAIALNLLGGFAQKGYLKRIGAYLESRGPGRDPRHLVVWQIAEEKLEKVRGFFEEFPEIVYADSRPGYPVFPYTVSMLIRAGSLGELGIFVKQIEARIGQWPHRIIATIREIKKTPVRYFPKELDSWWIRQRLLADPAFV
ncbi:MAG: hypothetical protein BWY42_00177 [Candidatus Omnitrophica bacterium ADurb.Bin277]|nr:MAG: hypothetical protein BWY42_00177 [Candidatus Omnitrophica bacterium ADurb.Bin277]